VLIDARTDANFDADDRLIVGARRLPDNVDQWKLQIAKDHPFLVYKNSQRAKAGKPFRQNSATCCSCEVTQPAARRRSFGRGSNTTPRTMARGTKPRRSWRYWELPMLRISNGSASGYVPHRSVCFVKPVEAPTFAWQIPSTYILCTGFGFRPTAERCREAGWPVLEIDCGHDAMIIKPRELAELLMSVPRAPET
jgi:hypothetical protein